jgi:hypothetical protein
MKIQDLINMCQARIAYLSQVRASAVHLGDISQVDRADTEIASTQDTLNRLLTL